MKCGRANNPERQTKRRSLRSLGMAELFSGGCPDGAWSVHCSLSCLVRMEPGQGDTRRHLAAWSPWPRRRPRVGWWMQQNLSPLAVGGCECARGWGDSVDGQPNRAVGLRSAIIDRRSRGVFDACRGCDHARHCRREEIRLPVWKKPILQLRGQWAHCAFGCVWQLQAGISRDFRGRGSAGHTLRCCRFCASTGRRSITRKLEAQGTGGRK